MNLTDVCVKEFGGNLTSQPARDAPLLCVCFKLVFVVSSQVPVPACITLLLCLFPLLKHLLENAFKISLTEKINI